MTQFEFSTSRSKSAAAESVAYLGRLAKYLPPPFRLWPQFRFLPDCDHELRMRGEDSACPVAVK